MKSAITLSLTLLASAPLAHADSIVDISQNSSRLLTAMDRDLDYLSDNVKNCTKYHEQIDEMMLTPIEQDVKEAQERIRAVFGKMREAQSRDCVRPSNEDLQKAIQAAESIQKAVSEKLAIANKPTFQLMGMTPDKALTKAMTAATDGSWPKCKPEQRNNPASTPQLKAYNSLKQKMILIRALMKTLKEETENLLRGRGEEVCKKA